MKRKYLYTWKYCMYCGTRTTHLFNSKPCCLTCEMKKKLEEMVKEDVSHSTKSIRLNERKETLEKIDLIGFGDWHYGARNCDVKAIKDQIKWIKENKYARVILMGDLINCGTRSSVGAGTYDDEKIPHEQFEEVVEMLKPIKDKIYGLHQGNHEQRIFNETGINLSKMIADKLGTKYLGYSVFHKIKVKDINYIVYSTHGASGAVLPYTKIKKCTDLASSFNADLYLYGHVHAVQAVSSEYQEVDLRSGAILKGKRYFVLTGSYLSYADSYAEMKNLHPDKQGCARIRLDGKRKDCHVSI